MANTKTGIVIASNGQKTITVLNSFYRNHPLYKKRYVRSKKYLVHDEENKARLKDQVVIKQVRPLSRRKHWLLVEIINKERQIDAKEEVSDLSSTLEEEIMPAAAKKPAQKKKASPKDEAQKATSAEEEKKEAAPKIDKEPKAATEKEKKKGKEAEEKWYSKRVA